MLIRHPQSRDIDELVEMGARMHAESAYSFLPYDRRKVRRFIQSCIDDPAGFCGLVAEEDHRLVGLFAGSLIEYFFCNDVVASDIVLYVDPEHRQGLAALRLVRAFSEWAAKRGAREVCLSVSTNVKPDQTGAFYERLGFVRVGGVYKQRLG
jgi:GNAT superfamily N-acetyltransferase